MSMCEMHIKEIHFGLVLQEICDFFFHLSFDFYFALTLWVSLVLLSGYLVNTSKPNKSFFYGDFDNATSEPYHLVYLL